MATTAGRTKRELIDKLVGEFRTSGNQDNAFDSLAAEHLGVNRTDLHCLNIIENSGGLTAGGLAAEAALTTGAVTGVIDRLERVGYARRVPDPTDRRRVKVEVTPRFYANAERIWGPMRADWDATLAERFTSEQLEQAIDFLRAANEIGRRQLERLRQPRSGD
ncbi:MAG TPA: MarR family transcriptional regulator [Streptosporangiaceae bacterium]|nr:MarR family transcriptional regulator [Streptosporangiaceae bacterium]